MSESSSSPPGPRNLWLVWGREGFNSIFNFPTHGCFSRGRAGSTRSAGWGLRGGSLRSSLAEPEVLSHSGPSNCTGEDLKRKWLSPAYLKRVGWGQASGISVGRRCQLRATYQNPEEEGLGLRLGRDWYASNQLAFRRKGCGHS